MGTTPRAQKKVVHSVDTLAFTESLGLQTFRKGKRKTWPKADDEVLLARLNELYPSQYSENTLKVRNIDWERVSDAFHGDRKARECRKRWASSLDPNLRRGKWTLEEDELLVKQYEKYGPLWQQVALEISGRTEHQCLKRYYEVLDPSVRNRLQPWTEEEDFLLIEMVTRHGTKWKTIASELLGRPSLTCRNRWRNLVTAIVRGRASPIIMDKMAGKLDVGGGEVVKGDFRVPKPVSVKAAASEPAPQISINDGYAYKSDAHVTPTNSLTTPLKTSQNDSPINLMSLELPTGKLQGLEPALRLYTRTSTGHLRPPLSPVTEWKYTLTAADSGVSAPAEFTGHDALLALLAAGGQIRLEHLAQCLLHYASQYNLQISVHHHHHHNQTLSPAHKGQKRHNPPNTEESPKKISKNVDGDNAVRNNGKILHRKEIPGFPQPHQRLAGLSGTPPAASLGDFEKQGYCIEPEAQLGRFLHFNYLPPLTPVPRLQSLASSPDTSSRESTQHHQNTATSHFPHDACEYTRVSGVSENTRTSHFMKSPSKNEPLAAKESDLVQLLNVSNLKIEGDSNFVIPFSRVVQVAREPDSVTPNFFTRGASDELGDLPLERLHLSEETDNDHELELAFFGTNDDVLHLSGRISSEFADRSKNFEKKGKIEGVQGDAKKHDPIQQLQPVSQHHPLHCLTGTHTPVPPGDFANLEEDEEDEDAFLSSWGFYSMWNKPQEPQQTLEFSEEGSAWFPFNPS